MLTHLTGRQWSELVLFFRVEHEDKEEREARAQELKLRTFFDRKLAKQQRRRG